MAEIKDAFSSSVSWQSHLIKTNFSETLISSSDYTTKACRLIRDSIYLWLSIFNPEKFTLLTSSSHTRIWKFSAPSRSLRTRQLCWFWFGVAASTGGDFNWWLLVWGWWRKWRFPGLFPQLMVRTEAKGRCSSRFSFGRYSRGVALPHLDALGCKLLTVEMECSSVRYESEKEEEIVPV